MTTNDPRPDHTDGATPNPDRPRPYGSPDGNQYGDAGTSGSYPAGSYGSGSYGAGQDAPGYSAPDYGTPGYSAPGYSAPGYTGGYPTADSEPQYIPEHPAYAGYAATASQGAVYGNSGYAYPTAGQPAPGYQGYPAGQYYGNYPYGYGQAGYGQPVPPKRTKRRRALTGVGAAVLAMGLVLSGVAIAESRNSDSTSQAQSPTIGNGSLGNGSTGNGSIGNGSTGGAPAGNGVLPGGSGSTQNGQSTSASVATATQQVGVVTIVSVLGYQTAESAGTGMILTSDGEILTNNHVINGATSITVTVESTGKQYRADVVGTAPTKDVAVLKLRNASGLTPAKIDQTPNVSVGDSVIGVGNAGGTGTLRAAAGKVTALDRSITASDESGATPEKLTGLIETDAGIISGDSGGPLYDSSGEIIGMDTAASTANSTTQTAYAISIDNALTVADQIESGAKSSVIHIGLPAFIGVSVATTATNGAGIAAVVQGGPAAKAGITAGSVITAVGGTKVADATALKTALSAYKPGQSVSLTWTDASGQSHTASTTTISGPAD